MKILTSYSLPVSWHGGLETLGYLDTKRGFSHDSFTEAFTETQEKVWRLRPPGRCKH